jgi:Domain of unknown function (DUF4375)
MKREEVARLVELLEGEINNGGFHQFFYNSPGNETAKMIEALKKIGACKAANIVERAAAMFPGGMPPTDRTKRQDLLLEQVDPQIKIFEKLNQEFFSYPDDLQGLLEKYMDW